MLVDGSIFSAGARRAAGLAVATALALALAGSAQAYDAAPGWTASNYVTGFAHPADAAGPVGLAFDGSGNLLVTDAETASLHKVPPGGGTADSTKLRDGYGGATGLAFDKDGHLYMARGLQHDVVELNPASGEVIRTVVSGLPCPAALATDPISGDLFVSNVFCPGGGIMRISGFQNGPGVVQQYAGGKDADGLTFAPDGTLYAASEGKILRIAGTNTGTPGSVTEVASVPTADGIAYSPANASDDAFLLVAANNGTISRVDMDGTVTAVITNASRGDLVTVGPDHCLYANLQDSVIKIGPSSGICGFATPAGSVLGDKAQQRVVDTAVKAKAPKSVKRGSRFSITFTVADKSSNPAHLTTFTDTIPKGTKFVSARSAKGVACKARKRTVTCRKAGIAAKKSFTIKLTLRSVSGSLYKNVARVKSNDLDPAPGNNRTITKIKVRSGNSVLGVQRQGGGLPRTTG